MHASFVASNANADGFAALWTYQHHIGDADRTFVLDAPGIQVPTAFGLHLFLVLGTNIHTLDGDKALIRKYIDDFPALSLVFQASGDNFYGIAFANFDFHYFRSCAG
jgi:hypothetical protein